MDNWAIIKSGGKQYFVKEGQKIAIEKLKEESKEKINFSQVLAIKSDKGLSIGKPLVDKAKVQGKLIENFKDKKIRVVKFKSKSRYTRTSGHRHQKSRILIEKITN